MVKMSIAMMMMTNDEYDDVYKKVFDLQTNTTRTCIAACDTTYYTQVLVQKIASDATCYIWFVGVGWETWHHLQNLH